MTADEPQLTRPYRVEVTAEWLAEQERKRAAYEASRAAWGAKVSSAFADGHDRERHLIDPKQFRLEL